MEKDTERNSIKTALPLRSNRGTESSHRYAKLKLYGYWRSSSTWRVYIALCAKDISFEYESINILQGASRTDDFMSVNAMKQIPVLDCVDTGSESGLEGENECIRITQSLPIIEFLEEAFPEDGCSLLPDGIVDRARVREIAEIVNSGVQPLQNLSVLEMIDEVGRGCVEVKLGKGKEFGKYHIEKGLRAIENLVTGYTRERTGQFAIGTSRPTLADAFIVPQMYNARRFHIDLQIVCPTLLQVEAHCLNHPWFKFSHPDSVRGLHP